MLFEKSIPFLKQAFHKTAEERFPLPFREFDEDSLLQDSAEATARPNYSAPLCS